ncbi:MAG: hypothetical protein DMG59_03880 [Acidobacteria bacterium]|nr:MAG: hypothetical protein DMG59_03880 [Acidobacteriota bacterium]
MLVRLMPCAAWKKLFEEWYAASERYRAAVIVTRHLGNLMFEEAHERAERAKAECSSAESAMRAHEQQHGCAGGARALKDSA